MSLKRHTLLTELLLMLCIAGISGWYGWQYVSAIDDTEMLRNTTMLPIPVLPGAIHFAVGRGVGVAHEKEISEIVNFLENLIDRATNTRARLETLEVELRESTATA